MSLDLTLEQLKQIVPGNPHLEHWHEAFCEILPDYDITTPKRLAAFLAQSAHESGNFTAIKENLNYRPETLMKLFAHHFPGGLAEAQHYCAQPNKQEAIANRIYANRMGNGDEESGEGWEYRGRGWLQTTGKHGYIELSDATQIDFVSNPDAVATPEGAAISAAVYWEKHNLNHFVDNNDFVGLTRHINGGTIGLEERMARFQHAMSVLA